MIDYKRQILSIDVLGSSRCNLNCSFCFLHKNDQFNDYNQQVMDSWENGTYVDNILATIDRLSPSRDTVVELDFWGGEPTLGMSSINQSLPRLVRELPNIKTYFFSSNWVVYPQQFMQFLHIIDDNISHDWEFKMQHSIDGPDGRALTEGHPGSWEKYIANYKRFANEFYTEKFVHLKYSQININSILSKENYLDTFMDIDLMTEYFNKMSANVDLINEIFLQAYNNSDFSKPLIKVNYRVPGTSVPFDFTSEEGAKLQLVDYNWRLVRPNLPLKARGIIPTFFRAGIQPTPQVETTTLYGGCIYFSHSLMILPDGSVCHCNGEYINSIDTYIEGLKKENNEKELAFCECTNAGFHNPLKMSDEELQYHSDFLFNNYRIISAPIIYLKNASCKELAKVGFIPTYYNSEEGQKELLQLFCIIGNYTNCTRENERATFVSQLSSFNQYKQYFNGMIQNVHKHFLYNIKENETI